MMNRLLCIGFGIFLAFATIGVAIPQETKDDPKPEPVAEESVGSDVYYGKVHVLKKKNADKSEVIDVISFELLGTKGQEIPPFILVFNSKEREQAAIKQNGKALWLEGGLGFSGQRNFIYVTGLLRRE